MRKQNDHRGSEANEALGAFRMVFFDGDFRVEQVVSGRSLVENSVEYGVTEFLEKTAAKLESDFFLLLMHPKSGEFSWKTMTLPKMFRIF